nr:hypothetical protein [Nostoc sp. ChiSLP03a]MDZ8213292.1 hypothetical protein [Nostoc sp. ChiSLP03a]
MTRSHLYFGCDRSNYGSLLDRRDRIQVRELQEINYPILWGGHPARPVHRAGETLTPQEKLYIFLFVSPLCVGLLISLHSRFIGNHQPSKGELERI